MKLFADPFGDDSPAEYLLQLIEFEETDELRITTSIILCFNEHRLTQVLLENGR